MGREVRMVRADWKHPRDEDGRYKPLHDGFNKDLADWNEGNDRWRKGLMRDYLTDGWKPIDAEDCKSYADWSGPQPTSDKYMPDWPAEQRTHLMMYEDTSEGTPISPAFATPGELARWLADHGASAFGSMKATYEQWLATCKAGSAPSAVFTREDGLISGVEGMAK